jgi:cysteine synthase A
LGNTIMPRNLEHSQFDEVHWLDGLTGYGATRLLHQRHAVFGGPTTGATWWVAKEVAARFPDRMVVAIGADDGERYLDTAFDDDWLHKQGFTCGEPKMRPVTCESLAQVSQTLHWAMLHWRRRTLEAVVGSLPDSSAHPLL